MRTPQPEKQLLVAETRDELAAALGMRDAGEQAMPGIRGAHAAGLLVAIQRQREGLDVRAPEGAC